MKPAFLTNGSKKFSEFVKPDLIDLFVFRVVVNPDGSPSTAFAWPSPIRKHKARKARQFLRLYNRHMCFIPTFSEPDAHWSRRAPSPPSANQGPRRERRELPLGRTPQSRPAPGDNRAPSRVRKSLRISTTPTTRERNKTIPRLETAPHGVKTPAPPADR